MKRSKCKEKILILNLALVEIAICFVLIWWFQCREKMLISIWFRGAGKAIIHWSRKHKIFFFNQEQFKYDIVLLRKAFFRTFTFTPDFHLFQIGWIWILQIIWKFQNVNDVRSLFAKKIYCECESWEQNKIYSNEEIFLILIITNRFRVFV